MSEQSEWGVPPPPEITPSAVPVYTNERSRYRLGYVTETEPGKGDGYYAIWDRLTDSDRRFPLTSEGWQQAWGVYTELEPASHERPVSMPVQIPEAPPAPGPSKKSKRGVFAGGGTALLVIVVLILKFLVFTGVNEATKPGGALHKTIIEDDFHTKGDWEVIDDARETAQFVEGEYRIVVKQPGDDFASIRGFSGLQWDRVLVETVAAKASVDTPEGAYGVLCVVDKEHVYIFEIDPDSGEYFVGKAEGSTATILQTGVDTNAVRSGAASNTIEGDCLAQGPGKPTTLVLSVNGTELVRVDDPQGLSGFTGMGLRVESRDGGTDVGFGSALMERA